MARVVWYEGTSICYCVFLLHKYIMIWEKKHDVTEGWDWLSQSWVIKMFMNLEWWKCKYRTKQHVEAIYRQISKDMRRIEWACTWKISNIWEAQKTTNKESRWGKTWHITFFQHKNVWYHCVGLQWYASLYDKVYRTRIKFLLRQTKSCHSSKGTGGKNLKMPWNLVVVVMQTMQLAQNRLLYDQMVILLFWRL